MVGDNEDDTACFAQVPSRPSPIATRHQPQQPEQRQDGVDRVLKGMAAIWQVQEGQGDDLEPQPWLDASRPAALWLVSGSVSV